MVPDAGYIAFALEEVRCAVSDVMVRTGIQMRDTAMPRSIARRAGGRLRVLEAMVRKFIVLIALGLKLAPVQARPPASPCKGPDPVPEDGVEIVHFPRAHVRRLRLLPGFVDAFNRDNLAPGCRANGPVPLARLWARFNAIARVLASPEAHARRVARGLARLKRASEPAPVIRPIPRSHRLGPELGLLAGALPMQLRAAFANWNETG